jgi:drug/metabolite transporter (DMT)-like permease
LEPGRSSTLGDVKSGDHPTQAAAHTRPNAARKSALVGLTLLILTLLGWSSVPLFVTHFSGAMDGWTQNGWRYGFAAVLWAPVLVWAIVRGTMPAGLWRASVAPSVFNALGQAAFTWSFYNVDTATGAFGLRVQIVFLAVGAYLMFPSERALLRRPGAWLGIVLVLGGVLGTMLLRADHGSRPLAVGGWGSPMLGMAMAVVAGLLFACYALCVRKCMHGYPPVTAFAAVSQITAAISMAIMVALARDPHTKSLDLGAAVWGLSAGQMAILAASAVIGIALGHTFYFVSIARLGVATTSGVLQLQPFCVAIAQFMVFGELMTTGQWASGTIAVIGALVLLYAQWRLTHAGGTPLGADAAEALPPIAGIESEGIEVAEMDAMPVESDGVKERGR